MKSEQEALTGQKSPFYQCLPTHVICGFHVFFSFLSYPSSEQINHIFRVPTLIGGNRVLQHALQQNYTKVQQNNRANNTIWQILQPYIFYDSNTAKSACTFENQSEHVSVFTKVIFNRYVSASTCSTCILIMHVTYRCICMIQTGSTLNKNESEYMSMQIFIRQMMKYRYCKVSLNESDFEILTYS